MEQFILKNWRVVTSIDQMEPLEVRQWISYLRQEDFLSDSDNFFDPEWEFYQEELWVYEWIWNPNPTQSFKLTDIFGWPGDNQMGAIFLDEELNPIFLNGDMDIVNNPDYSNLDPRLEQLRKEFAHLRYLQEHNGTCSNPEWCRQQREIANKIRESWKD